MSTEYKIKFPVPAGYDLSAFLRKLPSPINRATMSEIYNYKIERDSFFCHRHHFQQKVRHIKLH